MGIFDRKKEDLREVLELPAETEPDEVIDLRDEALAAWEDAASLVEYDDDFDAIRRDRNRDGVLPRDLLPRR